MKIAPVTRKRPEQFETDKNGRPNLTLAADNSAPAENNFNDLLSEIRRLHAESDRLRGRIQELEDLADTDAFLPIFNRRAFERELQREVALADRHRTPLSVVFIDLNGFKQVNDRFSHAAGDAVLRNVADILTHSVRDTDVVGRLGGDEFGVILHRSNYDDAALKAQRLAEAIAGQPIIFEGHHCQVGAAAGVCAWRKGESAEEILARADAAMYADKQAGKAAGEDADSAKGSAA